MEEGYLKEVLKMTNLLQNIEVLQSKNTFFEQRQGLMIGEINELKQLNANLEKRIEEGQVQIRPL